MNNNSLVSHEIHNAQFVRTVTATRVLLAMANLGDSLWRESFTTSLAGEHEAPWSEARPDDQHN